MTLKGKGGPVDTVQQGNQLIDSLPSRQRNSVLSQCARVELDFGTVLCEAGEPFKYVYFPITGNITLVNSLAGQVPFETESIGNEGMLGSSLSLAMNRAPQKGMVQTPCLALQMKAKKLQAAFLRHPALSRTLQRYLYVTLLELSQTTACIRYHDVGKRLARSLLLAHDRAQTNHLHLTHKALADMLGVQRGAVTLVASQWQREGIIRYSRGKIFILDRGRLEASSCECYDASIENYASILS